MTILIVTFLILVALLALLGTAGANGRDEDED